MNNENQGEIHSFNETKDSWRPENAMVDLQKTLEDNANKVYVPYCCVERRNMVKKTNLTLD